MAPILFFWDSAIETDLIVIKYHADYILEIFPFVLQVHLLWFDILCAIICYILFIFSLLRNIYFYFIFLIGNLLLAADAFP